VKTLWSGRLTPPSRSSCATLHGQSTPLPTPAEAMAYALEHSFYFEAVRPVKKVIEEALRYGVGGVTEATLQLAGAAAGLLTRGERATTGQMLQHETDMVQWATAGKGSRRACAPKRSRPAS